MCPCVVWKLYLAIDSLSDLIDLLFAQRSHFFPETGHQLDWIDQFIGHSWTEVSHAEKDFFGFYSAIGSLFLLRNILTFETFLLFLLLMKYQTVFCYSVMSDSMIMDAIASFLVLPNRLVVPLVPGLHVAQLRCPLPRVKPRFLHVLH